MVPGRKARPRVLTTLFLCMICVCAVLLPVGCSQDEPALGNTPAEQANATASAAANDVVSPTIVESIVAGGDTKETARLWSSSVKSQLARISKILIGVEGAETEANTALGNQIEMLDPELLQEKEVYHGPSVKVTEIAPAEGLEPLPAIQADAGAFTGNIRELLSLVPGESDAGVRFKLFGIDRDGIYLTTRQRLSARGTHDGNPVRSYAVVDAKWIPPAENEEGAKPRLVGFSMPKLTRTELVSKTDAMFDDIAGPILGGNAAWNEQLQLGMNTWVRHIERTLNPDFLGYHGVAVRDVNGDDLEDLYLCQPGGLPNLLFMQQPDGTLVDASKTARVDWLDNSTGAILVDLDNDGDADLAVATRTAFLIMENNGSGKFSVRERLSNIAMGYSPTAADYDQDGDLDILVLRYASDNKVGDFPTPHPFHSARNGGANVLLQNQGDFGFVDVTDESGLGVENYRFSFAASWEDYDNDGDVDVYIANDFGPNHLFRNEGTHFVDESDQSATQDWGFGMSATWADYDRDGYMDLYVSSMFSGAGNQIVAKADFNPSMPENTRGKYLKMVRGNTLMRNSGKGRFADVTNPMVEGFGGWAWGTKFADLNNDGWEDLYVANGYISQPDKDDL